MKRVTLFRNGERNNGEVVALPESLESLLSLASSKIGIAAKRIFIHNGGEICDINMIRDEDVLYVSCGEPFVREEMQQEVSCVGKLTDNGEWIRLNVGGKYFTTTRWTLIAKEPSSMLARMFANDEGSILSPSNRDENGAYLIDRSPKYFEPILNYLRHSQLIIDPGIPMQGVLEEAKFFGIESIVKQLESMMLETQKDRLPLTRRDVINVLIYSGKNLELRFQGVNLAGADLSHLDLRNINFKYACLRGCRLRFANLNWCIMERADLSEANLEGAQLQGIRMMCVNLEKADMRSCNFEDPAGCRANLEGANLKGANLEGSCMSGVNLRVATLKNANLQNCDLRGAVLAGADLEHCNLSGSDLHEANLRGANLKDAAFELLLTPIHMSQTVR